MKRALVCAVLCLALSLPAFAANKIIAVAGHLPGANGTTWTTDVSLTNNSSSSATVELVFHPEDGVARSRTITLGANQSQLLEDAVSPGSFPGSNPSAWSGQLEVRSSSDISASAHIFTGASAGGTFGSTFEAFDPSVLSGGGSMTGLISSSRFRSNVAFANPDDRGASVDFVLRREDGSIASSRHLDLPPHSTRQLPVSDDRGPSADDSRLSLSWTSNVPAYAVGSVIDNKSGDPTNAQSTSGGATSLYFPFVGRVPGNLATFWSTSVAVTSTSDDAGNVTLAYQDASGQTYIKTLPISGRGTVKSDDLNAFIGAPNGQGTLKVTSTTRVVGAVRVFNTQTDGSTYGSAVLPQENIVRSSNVRIKGVRRDASYRLNVGITNDDTSATGGSIHLFDDSGREVETEPFHVEHGAAVQISMGHGGDVRSGEIEVDTDGIPVTVLVSDVDNRTGDTVVHESEQENERQHELEVQISPRSATAGTPVTFTAGNIGTNVSAINWNFGDGSTGTGATVTHTYASEGEFQVTVEVVLTGGAVVRDREDVRVSGTGSTTPSGPIDFTFSPAAPAAGQQVTFTASGAANGGTFNWQFPGNVRLTGSVVTFTFPAAGSFEVELELEREGSATVRATHEIVVGGGAAGGTQAATSVDFSWSPQTPKAGQAVTFTASFDRQPPAGSVVTWRMPDNARPTGTSSTFTFASAGTFKIRVQLEQAGQASIETEKTITVQP